MRTPPGDALQRLLKEDDRVTVEELDEDRAADLASYEGLEEAKKRRPR